LHFVAHTINGNGCKSARETLRALEATYRDRRLTFRHFPQGKCKELHWQAVRESLDCVTMPDGEVFLLPRFELIAWAATVGELCDQLA